MDLIYGNIIYVTNDLHSDPVINKFMYNKLAELCPKSKEEYENYVTIIRVYVNIKFFGVLYNDEVLKELKKFTVLTL
jgi:hypothetical protein